MLELYNDDNLVVMEDLIERGILVDVVYGDCIYESHDFDWSVSAYELLKENGIFYLQTDQHTVANWKIYLDILFGESNFINWIITIQEWGGTSNRFFPRKHDDILMYAKGKNYKFYPDRIQIPKVTAGTKLDKKGTGLKTPCDVFYDLGNFPTTSPERIKTPDGKNIQWQKPEKLYNRILQVCTNPNDTILDPFMGSGSLGKYCVKNNLNYIGIEKNKDIFLLAKENIELVSGK